MTSRRKTSISRPEGREHGSAESADALDVLAKAMTEKELLQAILDCARSLSWSCYHTWNSIHSPAGFPDLTLAGHGRVIFAELKRENGKLTNAQREWITALDEAGQDVHIWRPSDWLSGRIEEVLR